MYSVTAFGLNHYVCCEDLYGVSAVLEYSKLVDMFIYLGNTLLFLDRQEILSCFLAGRKYSAVSRPANIGQGHSKMFITVKCQSRTLTDILDIKCHSMTDVHDIKH